MAEDEPPSRPLGPPGRNLPEIDPRVAWYRAVDAAREFDYGYLMRNNHNRNNGNGLIGKFLTPVAITVTAAAVLAIGAIVYQNDAELSLVKERQDQVREELSRTRSSIGRIDDLIEDLGNSRIDRADLRNALLGTVRDLDRLKQLSEQLQQHEAVLDQRIEAQTQSRSEREAIARDVRDIRQWSERIENHLDALDIRVQNLEEAMSVTRYDHDRFRSRPAPPPPIGDSSLGVPAGPGDPDMP